MAGFVNVVIPPLSDPLTYAVPVDCSSVDVGSQVVVPLGGQRTVHGFVVSKTIEVSLIGTIKPIRGLVSDDRCFLPEQLEFFKWVAEYYGEPLSNVIDVAIPHATPPKIEKIVHIVSDFSGTITGKLQKQIVDHIKASGGACSMTTLGRQFTGAAAAVKALEKKKAVTIDIQKLRTETSITPPDWAKTDVQLSAAQNQIVHTILKNVHERTFESYLLHGVTGSGKTEVYIEAIREAMRLGRGAIVIVPEIALTPQLVTRFQARLGNEVAVLHSGLSKRTRWDAWNDLIQGKKKVAIGARSAIFAPVQDLGIVIVDEEHDSSFKQQEGLRYNARDIAIVRAKLSKAPVVLGSATPSLESYARATQGKISMLPLAVRHRSGSSVSIEVVDLTKVKPWEMPSKNISPKLMMAIQDALEKKEQVFLLYNRRGFANYYQCERCEHVLLCPNCSVSLTYHQFNNSLVCHYCFLKMIPPTLCGTCPRVEGQTPGTYTLRGSGTERTQEEVEALFPTAKVLRLDRDVVSDLESYEGILNAVRNHECDILVGTQMIAKGHDLPNVTLGAVIDCDVGLHMPDFRAGEKVFQLLTQLAGRTGRGAVPGKVILQTRVAGNGSIQFAARNDYEGFAKNELESRQALNYPPFHRLLRIVCSSTDESMLQQGAEFIRKLIEHYEETSKLPLSILGPAPCPLTKLKAEFRWHLMIKSSSATALVHLIPYLREHMPKKKGVKIVYDLDPYDML